MLVPFQIPYLIRSLTKSAFAIGMVNFALLLAWLLPPAAPVVATLYGVSYLASFALGGFRWLRNTEKSKSVELQTPDEPLENRYVFLDVHNMRPLVLFEGVCRDSTAGSNQRGNSGRRLS